MSARRWIALLLWGFCVAGLRAAPISVLQPDRCNDSRVAGIDPQQRVMRSPVAELFDGGFLAARPVSFSRPASPAEPTYSAPSRPASVPETRSWHSGTDPPAVCC